MRHFERAGMAAAQSGERRRIVVGRLFGIVITCGEQMPGHEGCARGHGHAVEKVAARDVAVIPSSRSPNSRSPSSRSPSSRSPSSAVSWFGVDRFAHVGSLMNATRLRLALGLFHCQFRALEADAAVGAVAKRLVHRTAAAAERKCGLAGEVIGGSVASTSSIEPSGASTRYGPLGRTVIFT